MKPRLQWIIILALVVGWLTAARGAAQPAPRRVQTQDGISFTLPEGYRTAPELTELPGLQRRFELAFADAGAGSGSAGSPIRLFVLRAPELATSEMPLGNADTRVSADVGAAFAQTFAADIQRALALQPDEIRGSGYDATRSRLWMTFIRGTALSEGESFTVLAHFTRTALVMMFVVSDVARAHDASALVQQIVATGTLAAEARPGNTGPDHLRIMGARMVGGAGGAAIGSTLGVLCFGALLGLCLRRLGLTAARSAALALASMPAVALATAGAMRILDGVLVVQLLVYFVMGVFGYRHLRQWLERRPGPPGGSLLADASGLTTLEYAVLFVLICIGALAIWTQLGQSLGEQVGRGEVQLDAAFARSADQARPSSKAAGPMSADREPPGPPVVSPGSRDGNGPQPTRQPAATSNTSASTPNGLERAGGANPASGSSGWLDGLKSATTEHPSVQQLTRDHPIATAIVKEAAVVAAETFIPGVAAVNAARTLADEQASRVDKAVAAAVLVTSVVPPLAAAIKGAKEASTIAKAAREVSQTTKAIETSAEVVTDGARAAERAAEAERTAAHAVEAEQAAARAASTEKAVVENTHGGGVASSPGKGSGSAPPLSSATQLDVAQVVSNPRSLWGRSANEIAGSFNAAGYKATVRRSTKGSQAAEIIEIRGHREITQIQVHPGGGRHGGAYVKVSTSTQGKIKVVDPATYRPTPGENATIEKIAEP